MNRDIIDKAIALLKVKCRGDNGTYTCSGGWEYFEKSLAEVGVDKDEIAVYTYWARCHGLECDCAILAASFPLRRVDISAGGHYDR